MSGQPLGSTQIFIAGLVCGFLVLIAVVVLSLVRRRSGGGAPSGGERSTNAVEAKEEKQRKFKERQDAFIAAREQKQLEKKQLQENALSARAEKQRQFKENRDAAIAAKEQKRSEGKERKAPPERHASVANAPKVENQPAPVPPKVPAGHADKPVLKDVPKGKTPHERFKIPMANRSADSAGQSASAQDTPLAPLPARAVNPLPLADAPLVELPILMQIDTPASSTNVPVTGSFGASTEPASPAGEAIDAKKATPTPEAIDGVLQSAENPPAADAFNIFTDIAEEESDISKFAKTLKNVDIKDLHKEVEDLAHQLKGWR